METEKKGKAWLFTLSQGNLNGISQGKGKNLPLLKGFSLSQIKCQLQTSGSAKS